MANITGKEDSLLVMSGTMGNQIVLRSLLAQPPHAVLCHCQSHILKSEAGGCSSLSQAHMQPCIPVNGQYLTLEDIQRDVDTRDNIYIAPTRVISLENILAGVITPLESERIWEAVAAGAGSLVDYLDCFDTAYMCFSKGLAAPVGSIIVGPKSISQHCRWVRKSIGADIQQAGIMSSAARVAVEDNFENRPHGEGGMLRETHKKAKFIEKMWVDRSGVVSRPVDTNMVCLDLPHSGITVDRMICVGREEGVKLFGGRTVVHCQIADDAIVRLGNVFDRVLSSTEKRDDVVQESDWVYR